VTESPGCAWCGHPLPAARAPAAGRPRRYCRRSCRQRAYEARRRLAEREHDEDELILERAAREDLLDRLDLLRRTVGDLEPDDDPAQALAWLRRAVEHAVEPVSRRRA
jgi:hypothetical protein